MPRTQNFDGFVEILSALLVTIILILTIKFLFIDTRIGCNKYFIKRLISVKEISRNENSDIFDRFLRLYAHEYLFYRKKYFTERTIMYHILYDGNYKGHDYINMARFTFFVNGVEQQIGINKCGGIEGLNIDLRRPPVPPVVKKAPTSVPLGE